MGLLLNRRREMGGETLPYDAEIKYLEATGTQWIDTGVVLNPDTYEYETKFVLSSGSNGTFSLAYNGWSGAYKCTPVGVGWWNKGYIINSTQAGYGSTSGINVGWDWGDVITMSLHGNVVTYNGSTYTMTRSSSGTSPSITQPIFGTNHISELAYGKCYYLKLWDNGSLVRDFIPVRVGTTGYLYDKVSKTIFGNSGSGSFTLGPDV